MHLIGALLLMIVIGLVALTQRQGKETTAEIAVAGLILVLFYIAVGNPNG